MAKKVNDTPGESRTFSRGRTETAVRAVADNSGLYDMIFMDMQMPEMDGIEATRRIRAIDTPYVRNVPIVAMTANVFREDIEKCLEMGMNAHLGKPLDFDIVLEKMKKYLLRTSAEA